MIQASTPVVDERPMLSEPIDERLYQQLVERIVEQLPDCAIILFGSRAGSGAGVASDVDLFVIAETQRDPLAVAGELYMATRPRTFALDIVVMTPTDVQQHRQALDPFVTEIIRRGRVLHGRIP